jgi:hypothetical protein
MPRGKFTKEQCALWVRRWWDSQSTATEFARQHGLLPASLTAWARAESGDEREPSAFVRVDLPPPREDVLLEVILRSGRRLRVAPGTDLTWLREVAQALEAEC